MIFADRLAAGGSGVVLPSAMNVHGSANPDAVDALQIAPIEAPIAIGVAFDRL